MFYVDDARATERALSKILSSDRNSSDRNHVVSFRGQRDGEQLSGEILLVVSAKDNGSVGGADGAICCREKKKE